MRKTFLTLFLSVIISTVGSAQVGINNPAPHSSAALDVTSTDKGFLPPRMTTAERDLINTPAPGLMIYNTSCRQPQYHNGSEWMNIDGTIARTRAIGDSYQGGKIGYLLQPGDVGYDACIQHGLIFSVNQLGGDGFGNGPQWYNGNYIVTGATGTAYGTGLSNTTAIVNAQGNNGSYAAKLCNDFVSGGYSDWYLPSKDELNKLYLNRVALGILDTGNYWSSSEVDNNRAWSQRFNTGLQTMANKSSLYQVHAVRSF